MEGRIIVLKQQLTLLIAYNSIVRAKLNLFKSEYFDDDFIDPQFEYFICAIKNEDTYINSTYDNFKAEHFLDIFDFKKNMTSFVEFIEKISAKYNFTIELINPKISATDLLINLFLHFYHADIPRAILFAQFVQVRYDTLFHGDLNKLIRWFKSPVDIPAEYRKRIPVSYQQIDTGEYIWVYSKEKAIEMRKMLSSEFSCTKLKDYVAEEFPGWDLRIHEVLLKYFLQSPEFTQRKGKVKYRSINIPSIGRKIGLSIEPTFHPQKVLRSEVVIDANTKAKENKGDRSILYAAGWSLTKKR
jgi:hypothetical protein